MIELNSIIKFYQSHDYYFRLFLNLAFTKKAHCSPGTIGVHQEVTMASFRKIILASGTNS